MALTQKNFADLITFSRNSSAWRFNAMGLLESVPANEPRFDYDPVTKQLRGLLIEEQRTNLFSQCSDYTQAVWGKTDTTVSTDDTLAPDGSPMQLLTQGEAGNGFMNRGTPIAITPGAVTGSQYFKRKVGDWVRLSVAKDGSGVNAGIAWFNLATGQKGAAIVTGTATGVSSRMTHVGNDIYRCEVTVTLADNTASVISLGVVGDNNSARIPSARYAWQIQLEQGSFATSPIPTVNAQITRAADVAYVGNTAPWFNPLQGTLYVEASASAIPVGIAGAATAGITGTYGITERILGMQFTATLIRAGGFGSKGLDTGLLNLAGTPVAGKVYKSACAWAVGDARGALNGTLSAQITATQIPGPLTRLTIGAINGPTQPLNGYVRAIRYYPRRLSDAELQALTA